MQALMERMRNTQDPAERQRLMAEHMRLMNEGMSMMGPMMSGPVSGQPCADNDMTCRMQRMQQQQGIMGQRMGMMQMMMQQMMEHMMQQGASAQPGTPAPKAAPNAPKGQDQ